MRIHEKFRLDWNELRIEVLAETDKEQRIATPIVEYGRPLTVLVAFLGLINYLGNGPFNYLIIFTSILSITTITKVTRIEPEPAEATAEAHPPTITTEE